MDTNNQTPQSTTYNEIVYIFENATSGYVVMQLDAIDLDRDGKYILSFKITVFQTFINQLYKLSAVLSHQREY